LMDTLGELGRSDFTVAIYHKSKEIWLYGDLVGIGSRVIPWDGESMQAMMAADWISRYDQMWHEVGNQDPKRQKDAMKGLETLFTDDGVTNMKVRPIDFLMVFKEYENQEAQKMQTGDHRTDWYRMQDKISSIVISEYLRRLGEYDQPLPDYLKELLEGEQPQANGTGKRFNPVNLMGILNRKKFRTV
jgi:hypothetical protein